MVTLKEKEQQWGVHRASHWGAADVGQTQQAPQHLAAMEPWKASPALPPQRQALF